VISISIVSHGHAALLERLLADLARLPATVPLELILTFNIAEPPPRNLGLLQMPLRLIHNARPQGFAANHNAAFAVAQGRWFCVLNPDIALPHDPFPHLLEQMQQHGAAVVAPAVLNPAGALEDSVRCFPTLGGLLRKGRGLHDGRCAFAVGDPPFEADWVAGMFMLFASPAYRAVGGFDEAFHLYYEDVDICVRLWRSGRKVLACPAVQVLHEAQRSSRRKLRFMGWHGRSLLRFFFKHGAQLRSLRA